MNSITNSVIRTSHILQWLGACAAIFAEKKAYLTELDSAIGDADHGINMARGFGKVAEKLPSVANADIGGILKAVGMTLIASVGGASGPLYGTFFLRAAEVVAGKAELAPADVSAMLTAGLAGIVARGRADVGDKTMVDAWTPAISALGVALQAGHAWAAAASACLAAAEQGVQATIPLVARKGRASYLGERSAGHQDPGATSSLYLLKALFDATLTPDQP
jgi:dihydroxyacetone kinase-like protein